MTLCDTVRSFGPKVTQNYRETRYCDFAPPDETVGVIDLSTGGDGTRGIAFLTDRLIVKLGEDARQLYYSEIRVTEIIPSYETAFEDELEISTPGAHIRISDCSLNKFFLRQLINNICRISATMRDSDREALYEKLTSDAMEHYAEQLLSDKPKRVPEAAAAVQEIAAAKKAALAKAQPSAPIELTEEKIQWISGEQPPVPSETPVKTADAVNSVSPAVTAENTPESVKISDYPANSAAVSAENTLKSDEPEDLDDMSHEETMSYLLDSITEINSEPERDDIKQMVPDIPERTETPQDLPEIQPQSAEPINTPDEAPVLPQLTKEPDSADIYILASCRIRELCEDGRLTMEQVNETVRTQLVPASEIFSGLDIANAPLPQAVKKRAVALTAAADRLTDYFSLGEDIAARVMFFMLYQMLSYTDRILQTDESKQRLNYFFVRFGAAGMVLSMLDANN